jgi:hypothetical protein
VSWAETHPTEGTEQFWKNFTSAIGQGRGEVPAATLGRLCRTVYMHQPTVRMPMLSAYVAALPDALLQDPDLDTDTARWAIGRLTEHPGIAGAAAASARGVLARAFEADIPLTRGLVLLELAEALAVQDVPPQAASRMLAPALLAGGEDAADTARFLAAAANATLREQVLDCLHDQALSGTGSGTPELARAVADWTAPGELSRFPLLHAATDLEQARRDGQLTGRAAVFCHVANILRNTGLDDISWHALQMACPGQQPTAGEAHDMLRCAQHLPEGSTHLDRTCLDLVRDTTQVDTDTLALAGLLRTRTREWIDPRDAALLDLVATTGRLQATDRKDHGAAAEDTAAVPRLLHSAAAPQAVREAATAALLAVLLSPRRLEAGTPGLKGELHELAAHGDNELIEAYARHAKRELPRSLTESPSLHACCFVLWRSDQGLPEGAAWLAARDDLVLGLLARAARKMTDPVRAQTVTELNQRNEGLSQEWLDLTQPPPQPGRLPWTRRILRRTR